MAGLAWSYAGRSYVLTAYVWSRGMSVAAYNRPPPTVLKMLMAASRQFMWTGRVTSGTNARSSASEFPTGSRPTESLTASKADMGHGYPDPGVQIDAQCAMWVQKVLRPWRANLRSTEDMSWYDIGVYWMRLALGVPDARDVDYAITVREGLLHGQDLSDHARRSRRQGKMTRFWADAIIAWEKLRDSMTVTGPRTSHEVLSMPLVGNPAVRDRGQVRADSDNAYWQARGVTHVRHLWDMTGWRRLSPAELLADIAELESLWSCVPTVWQATLEQPTPVQAGDWVVTDTGAPARVELKVNGGYMVMQHRQIAAGGWEATDLDRVAQRDVLPAVVESAHVSAERQVHWLVGPTHTHFASSRTRARLPKHGNSTLGGLRIGQAYKLLQPGRQTMTRAASAVQRAVAPPFSLKLRVAVHKIDTGPWPARIRNFSSDLARGTMPCGLAIKDCIDRRCAHCGAEQDNIGHFAQCSLLHPLRRWAECLCMTLGWPRPQPGWFPAFLVYGYLPRSGDPRVLTALHGAVLSAALHARRARTDQEAGRSCTAAELNGVAARRLRYHMLLDWRAATGQGYVEWRALDSARPTTHAAWAAAWGTLGEPRSGSGLRYKEGAAYVMPPQRT